MEVVHDRSFVQVCQLGHIIGLVEFRGIDLVGLVDMDITELSFVSTVSPLQNHVRLPSHLHTVIAKDRRCR